MDYAVAGMLATVPATIGLGSAAVRSYAGVAANILSVNSLTDTPVGIRNVMSMKTHRKMDIATLSTLAMMTFAKPFRKDKRAMCFHLGLLALVGTQFMLTDFETRNMTSAG